MTNPDQQPLHPSFPPFLPPSLPVRRLRHDDVAPSRADFPHRGALGRAAQQSDLERGRKGGREGDREGGRVMSKSGADGVISSPSFT